ncbi:uncharacterized protein LOC128930045 [Callithrix jacchus]
MTQRFKKVSGRVQHRLLEWAAPHQRKSSVAIRNSAAQVEEDLELKLEPFNSKCQAPARAQCPKRPTSHLIPQPPEILGQGAKHAAEADAPLHSGWVVGEHHGTEQPVARVNRSTRSRELGKLEQSKDHTSQTEQQQDCPESWAFRESTNTVTPFPSSSSAPLQTPRVVTGFDRGWTGAGNPRQGLRPGARQGGQCAASAEAWALRVAHCPAGPLLPRSPEPGSCSSPRPAPEGAAAQRGPRSGEDRRSGRCLPASPSGSRRSRGWRVSRKAGPLATPATQPLDSATSELLEGRPSHSPPAHSAHPARKREGGRRSRSAHTRSLPAGARTAERAQTTRRGRGRESWAPSPARSLGALSGSSRSPCIPSTAVLAAKTSLECKTEPWTTDGDKKFF